MNAFQQSAHNSPCVDTGALQSGHDDGNKNSIDLCDLILIMTVEPGFGGQEFISKCSQKLPFIREFAEGDLILQVDGGINRETARVCTKLGANSLVAGSYIFNAENISDAISSLR